MTFLETAQREFEKMRSRVVAADGYEGVEVAGLALVRFDGEPSVFLAQRTFDETDDEDVRETFEFPGGHLNPGEDAQAAAFREFSEEIDFPVPEGEVRGGWRSEDGVYQGFVYEPSTWPGTLDWKPTEEVQAVGWFTREDIEKMDNLRPEVRDQTDWDMIFNPVSGNEENDMLEEDENEPVLDEEAVERIGALTEEPEFNLLDFALEPIPVHGVLAPEDLATGDGRGFKPGSMTTRPLPIPFRFQRSDIGGHNGAVVTGSVDRLMRKDGLIHWEGRLLANDESEELIELIEFFGKFGVSVDGDSGSMDLEESERTGVSWFEAVRASGLTAVAIPAFAEAYVALGTHPDMPAVEEEFDAMVASGNLVGEFKRGKGWVTNPTETRRLHRYWTEPGQPGYNKIRWGTNGDFTRCVALVGEKIAKNSPEKMRYMKRICAEWHNDALGYWPGELGKPGNAPDTPENRKRAARHAASSETADFAEDVSGNAEAEIDYAGDAEEAVENTDSIEETDNGWEVVLTSSAAPTLALPPSSYFDFHPDTGATVIEDPDENGIRRTYGYAAEWGVCHIGFDGECVGAPADPSGGNYEDFHLGRTRTADGPISTGLITYKVNHRGRQQLLTETAEQAHFDNVAHAWAAVRLGEDDRGVWFSGVVLPHVPDEDIVLIEAAGQVSGEWKFGSLRGLQSVNIPGFPVLRASVEYNHEGEVVSLVASTFGNVSECEPSPFERMQALAAADAEARFEMAKAKWEKMI